MIAGSEMCSVRHRIAVSVPHESLLAAQSEERISSTHTYLDGDLRHLCRDALPLAVGPGGQLRQVQDPAPTRVIPEFVAEEEHLVKQPVDHGVGAGIEPQIIHQRRRTARVGGTESDNRGSFFYKIAAAKYFKNGTL